MRAALRTVAALAVLAVVSACAPQSQTRGPVTQEAALFADRFITEDGASLGLQVWQAPPEEPLRGVVIGIHGMNDYSQAFALPGPWFAEQGYTLYAYDQRGFGRSPDRGIWSSTETKIADLATLVSLVRARHPDVPLHLIGISMGGAVTMSALNAWPSLEVETATLVAPAVWGWRNMNPVYKSTLWISAHLMPGKTLSGSRLEIWPSDNIDMLRALSRDPLGIRETRIDAIYGLVGLMDRAYGAAGDLPVPTLLLYGEKDEVIPPRPMEAAAERFGCDTVFLRYPEGYHMLMRDLQREVVWTDVLAFMEERGEASAFRGNRAPVGGAACGLASR